MSLNLRALGTGYLDGRHVQSAEGQEHRIGVAVQRIVEAHEQGEQEHAGQGRKIPTAAGCGLADRAARRFPASWERAPARGHHAGREWSDRAVRGTSPAELIATPGTRIASLEAEGQTQIHELEQMQITTGGRLATT